jgi:hypothetical protein
VTGRTAGTALLALAVLAGPVALAGCTGSPSPAPGPGPSTSTAAPSPTAGYGDAVREAGPVAYWPLDETSGGVAAEALRGRFDAALAGGVVTGEPGAVTGRGTSVGLDGETAHVYVMDAADERAPELAPRGALSVELWFRAAPDAPAGRALLARWRWYGWGLAVEDGRITASVWERDGEAEPRETRLAGPALGDRWHHVVLSRDSASTRLLLDGVPVDEAPTKAPLFALSVAPDQDCCGVGGGVAFGRDADVDAGYAAGWLDEVAVYDRALTAAEAARHAAFAAS